MKWNDTKWTTGYFQQCACVNTIYFAPVVTTKYRMKNKSSTRGLSLEKSVLALHLYTPERTTWRKYLEHCSIYVEIGTIYQSS